MGALSTIYDNFTSVVSTALGATYTQIPNPYDLSVANQLLMKKGFGIGVKTGRSISLDLGTKRGRERTFSVTLTNLIAHLDHDTAGAKAADKAIVEDMLAVEVAIEKNNSLSGTVAKVDYVDDSGVQFLAVKGGGHSRFMMITVNFLVVYEETLP